MNRLPSGIRAAPFTLAIAARLIAASVAAHAEAPANVSVAFVGMTVGDMDRSIDFYRDVLDFAVESDQTRSMPGVDPATGLEGVQARTAQLRLGEERLVLTAYFAPRGRPFPADSRSNDHWFQHIAIIVRDMDAAYRRLQDVHVVHASPEPQQLPEWNRNAAGIRAFYFRDPDGHYLEALQFPPDKGSTRWHEPTDRLFLGIDHTAIVVADTERSVAFYRDRLGLRIAGTSENYGPEQERLNNVPGAHLRITTLRGESGPGVELLEYLAPRDGRAFPADARPNDAVHWEAALIVRDNDAAASRLQAAGTEIGARGGASDGILLRDPDGHALRVFDQPGEE